MPSILGGGDVIADALVSGTAKTIVNYLFFRLSVVLPVVVA
jgi:hypothetical protein